jgi:hypothetical protein
MIRRKLTQLEVTLDDTKELDDLIITCKPVIQGLASSSTATSSAPASSVPSFLTNKSFYQKHFLGKQTDSSQNTDSIQIESAASTVGSTSTAANIDSINTESNSAEVGFNPQPYNPSNRFQLNQEQQQQLR